jgi:hypothetical protein
MNKKENLVKDIVKFLSEVDANKINDDKWYVEESAYTILINRILGLTKEDFETDEKFTFFYNFLNNPTNKLIMISLEDSFHENYLNQDSFLRMINFLHNIAQDKLK